MSDHWEFYPCRMGESTAVISYDHGIGDTIDDLAIDTVLKVRIRFAHPDDGLPSREDLPVLSELEEALREFVEAQGGAYVGRITLEGWRYLYSYVQVDERIVQPFLAALADAKGYDVEFALEQDADKAAYWKDLRPSATDWRVIMDMRVIDTLIEHGDDLTRPRPIDHFATFPTKESRDRFRFWAEAENFAVTGSTDPEDPPQRYTIQVSHEAEARLAAITKVTIPMMQRVESLGGDYDGWGTTVQADRD